MMSTINKPTILRGWTGSSDTPKSMQMTAHFFGTKSQSLSHEKKSSENPKQVLLLPLPNLSTKSSDSTTSTDNTSGSASPGYASQFEQNTSVWFTPENSKVKIAHGLLAKGTRQEDLITIDPSNIQLNQNETDSLLQNYSQQPISTTPSHSAHLAPPQQPSYIGLRNRFNEYYVSSPPSQIPAAQSSAANDSPPTHSTILPKQAFVGLRLNQYQQMKKKVNYLQGPSYSGSMAQLPKQFPPQKLSIELSEEQPQQQQQVDYAQYENEHAFWKQIDSICSMRNTSSKKAGKIVNRIQPIKQDLYNSEQPSSHKCERRFSETKAAASASSSASKLLLPQLQQNLSVRHFSSGMSRQHKVEQQSDACSLSWQKYALNDQIESQYFGETEPKHRLTLPQRQQQLNQFIRNNETPIGYLKMSEEKQVPPPVYAKLQSLYKNDSFNSIPEGQFRSPRILLSPSIGSTRGDLKHRRKVITTAPVCATSPSADQRLSEVVIASLRPIKIEPLLRQEEIGFVERDAEESTSQKLNEFEFSFCQHKDQSKQEPQAASSLNCSSASKHGQKAKFNLKSRQQENLVKKIFHFDSSILPVSVTKSSRKPSIPTL